MTLLDTEMSWWAPGTKHYVTAGGLHVAVDPGLPFTDRPSITEAPRETVIFECNDDGSPITLTPLRTFPPGTSHDDAITQFEQET